ncbi:MAG: Anti-sigma factor antagonist RsbV [Acidimicrobiales bacterium]|jgi:anti-anti-sigma factor|nr:Anti-sigma factor antagonist RsbV [Acidimicrobiales bacterium]
MGQVMSDADDDADAAQPEWLAAVGILSSDIGAIVRDRRTVLVSLRGHVDLVVADELQRAVSAVIDDDVERVIFELEHLEFMDAAGLRVLVSARARLGGAIGSVVVRNPSAMIRRVLEVTLLGDMLADVD